MQKPLIPNVAIYDDFFDDGFADALLAFAQDSEPGFETSQVSMHNGGAGVDPAQRHSRVFAGSLGEYGDRFVTAVAKRLDELCGACGIPSIANAEYELELAAHGDGAVFAPHADVFTAAGRRPTDRVLSIVYYLHVRPEAFTGGELVLRDVLGSNEERRIEPRHGRLVAFPSIAPHEVARVSLPGNRFKDSRFALNCWVCR